MTGIYCQICKIAKDLFWAEEILCAETCVRVTPPSPLRTAYCSILALRTVYRHCLASRTAYRLITKNNHFGRFHLHEEV